MEFGIAPHAPECAAAVRLGGPAPARAHRIDQHQVGEGEPSVRVVLQIGQRAVLARQAELGDARSDQAEIEERRGRARSAIEHESHRSVRVGAFGHIGRIVDRSRAFARLIEQRKRSGRRRIVELAAGISIVLRDGIARQQRSTPGPSLFRPALISVTGAVRRAAADALARLAVVAIAQAPRQSRNGENRS